MNIKAWGGIVASNIIMLCHGPVLAADNVVYYLDEISLDKALLRVGQDFRLTILFQSLDVKGLKSKAFSSEGNIKTVLSKLLSAHSFDYKFINYDTVVIYRVTDKALALSPEEKQTRPSKSFDSKMPPGRYVEEIIISSRRWNKSLQSSPASVAAFSQDRLSSPDMGGVDQLSLYTSNVTLDYTATLSGSSNSLVSYIRGIGQSDFAISTDPAIGIYLDGIFLSRSIGSVVDLAEYDSVEIYKGPHGNLFSRNAIGGTINITSRKPGEDFRLKGQATTGSDQRNDFLIDMDIPIISDKLYGNILLSSRNRQGYGQRLDYEELTTADQTSLDKFYKDLPTSSELGNQNVDRLHGKIIWKANNDIEVSLITDAMRSRERTPVSTLLGFSNNKGSPSADSIGAFYNDCLMASGSAVGQEDLCSDLYAVNVDKDLSNDRTPFDNRFITGSPYQNYAKGPNRSDHDTLSLIGTLHWQLNDDFQLKYIAGYRQTKADLGRDGDKTPLLMDHTSYIYDHKQYSQEIQLDGIVPGTDIQWYGGFLYFNEKARMKTFVAIGGLPLMDLRATEKSNNISYNYFAHANIPLTSSLNFTAGFHYTEEEKKLQLNFHELEKFAVRLGVPQSDFPDPEDLTLLRPESPDQTSLKTLSPRFSLEYNYHDIFLYFSAAKSTKPGGFNYRAVLPSPVISSFGPEYAWSYEAGIKTTDINHRYYMNLAVFYTDYRELQLISQLGVTPEIENAGNASIWGVELEGRLEPTENLNISASLGYIDASYTTLSSTSRIKPDYNFQKTPKWSANVTANYIWQVKPAISLHLQGSYSYKSTVYNNAENSALLRQAPVHLVNGSMTAEFDNSDWAVTFGVNNLLNEQYIISGFNQPGVGFTEATFARPRNWYLSLTYFM